MYAKIFNRIFDSTIATDWQVRHVFEDFLKLADESGVVDMTFDSVVRRINMPEDIVKRAIAVLESPDPQSRTRDHEGRRLLRLYEDQDWGWVIANHAKYRSITNSFDLKRSNRERVAKYRSKSGRAIKEELNGYVYYALSKKHNEIKIGFSLNPWSRVRELKTARPDLEIVATERGCLATERQRHVEFSAHRSNGGEWFAFSSEIRTLVESLSCDDASTTVVTTALPTNTVVTTHASPSASASVPSGERFVRSGVFTKPEFSELELYAAKLGLPVFEINKFYDHYESNGWKVGRNPMKSWQAAMRNWKNNLQTYGTSKQNPPQRVDRSIGTANEGTAHKYAGLGRLAPNPNNGGPGA